MAHGGLIGVIAQDTARFTLFASSLISLETPPGSRVEWRIGHSVAANTNALCQQTLDTGAKWLWILGDDHAFTPTVLTRLLAVDADVVLPLCLTRVHPYKPVLFTGADSNGCRTRLNLDDHPKGGVIGIHSAGSAGMLIHRHVLEGLRQPWFRSGTTEAGGGVETGEDLYFCDQARQAGHRIKADLGCYLAHLTTAAIWPLHQPDGWTYGLSMSGGLQIAMPRDH